MHDGLNNFGRVSRVIPECERICYSASSNELGVLALQAEITPLEPDTDHTGAGNAPSERVFAPEERAHERNTRILSEKNRRIIHCGY